MKSNSDKIASISFPGHKINDEVPSVFQTEYLIFQIPLKMFMMSLADQQFCQPWRDLMVSQTDSQNYITDRF